MFVWSQGVEVQSVVTAFVLSTEARVLSERPAAQLSPDCAVAGKIPVERNDIRASTTSLCWQKRETQNLQGKRDTETRLQQPTGAQRDVSAMKSFVQKGLSSNPQHPCNETDPGGGAGSGQKQADPWYLVTYIF